MADIQSRHLVGKPACSRTSSRNGQPTVSKTLARSTLSRTAGHRRACSHLHVSWTVLKFSWIRWPWMKVDWLILTSSDILGASLMAKPLEKSLPTEWMRLMGLQSLQEMCWFMSFCWCHNIYNLYHRLTFMTPDWRKNLPTKPCALNHVLCHLDDGVINIWHWF